ncbi:hypothetical protein [Rhizobium rhizogenes]|uniref:hypothetical protein n=1 Tax=Rhizobium rhizogenes TaxID=359 RepID=UPI001F1C89AF|nr:hypothetical protein [Rhizobium rhizogenes]
MLPLGVSPGYAAPEQLGESVIEMNHESEWSRNEAEQRIGDVLDGAKSGQLQTIHDGDGSFEVRFIAKSKKDSAAKFLAKPEPIVD